MTQTAQPPRAAAEHPSTADAIAAAAFAFKASVEAPAAPAPEAAAETPDEEPLSGGAEEEPQPPARAEDPGRDGEGDDGPPVEAEADEAAGVGDGEAQPETPLPTSWPSDKAEMWRSLPPEAQAFIAQRDGQMTAAINLKFQEAAHLKKAHEAEIGEAQRNRTLYAEAVDEVLSLVAPQMPPRSMLDRDSGDYDPDAYHYRKALYEDTVAFLNRHAAQRRELAAQDAAQRFDALNGATRDAFIQSVPDAADQARAPALLQKLIDYAVSLGTPAELFEAPTTALEWHVLWKAREYDRLQSAKARVREAPRPEPRKAAPAVRPGVTTPRSAIEQSRAQRAMERLRKEGSVDAGAAALKHLLKGKLS